MKVDTEYTLWRGQWVIVGLRTNISKKKHSSQVESFKAHYGSHPLVLSKMWNDLVDHNSSIAEDLKMSPKELTEKGFDRFLAAQYFLWAYPRNAKQGSSPFGKCDKLMKGPKLWLWLKRIQALKELKIVWLDRFNDPNAETCIVTVDGTDCRIREPKHPHFPVDSKHNSQKFRSAGLKYELAIAIHSPNLVWVSRGVKCGVNDKTLFAEPGGLKEKIPAGKIAFADGSYRGHESKCAPPNPLDDPITQNIKSRSRLRQETFNGRIKNFKSIMNGKPFRHGVEKHGIVFESVCVILQYQMENGWPIYSVF